MKEDLRHWHKHASVHCCDIVGQVLSTSDLFQSENLSVRQRAAVVVLVSVIVELFERQADAGGGAFATTFESANNCPDDFTPCF